MKFLRAWIVPFVGIVAVMSLGGCGQSNVVRVSGTLTYKGKPVPDALITFEPSHGRQSWAETDEDGHFVVQYTAQQDGAVLGKHKLFVEFRPTTDAQKEAIMAGKQPKMAPEMKALFDKYSPTKSKHTIEITQATEDLKINLD